MDRFDTSRPPVSNPAPTRLGDLERLALLRVAMLAVFGSCALFAVIRLVDAWLTGRLTPWWGNALGAMAIAVLWLWFRRAPEQRASLSVHVSAIIALIALLLPVPYGMVSTIWWLSLIGFAMALMGTRRESLVWAIIVLGLVTAATFVEPLIRFEGAIDEPLVEGALARIAFAAVLIGIAIGFRGIIERRTRELVEARAEAQRSSEAKSRFMAHMSHELRTPLNGVIAMLDLVMRSDLAGDARSNLQTARGSARLLLRLIRDVLDATQLDDDALTLDEALFPLHGSLSDVLEPLAEQAKNAGSTLEATAESGLVERRIGDSLRVCQVVLNLVSNALKFTQAGRIEVRVAAGVGPDEVSITVRDTGCGIPSERLRDVFEPFVQVTDAPGQRHAGTGLGLSIARELALRMDGRIEVDSQVGVGTEFRVWLRLPAAPGIPRDAGPENLLAARQGERMPQPLPVCESLSVLVADDDRVNRVVFEEVLAALGHEVTAVADGVEAWELIRRERFDLLMTDLEMPRLGGLELAQRVRSWEEQERRQRLPIVAVSAHTHDEWREAATRSGIDGYLSKPFEMDALMVVLRDVLPERL